MRIKAIEIEGFRGFARKRYFDLDADALIITGANGQGKTSLFDAVLWALSGRIPRLKTDEKLISLYSEDGTARVSLELRSNANRYCEINRSFDGQKHRLSFKIDNEVHHDTEASFYLFKHLWPEALATEDSEIALTTAITRSIYLQQDLVREFIETDDDQERFNAASELVGAGRVTELQLELERARKAWSGATNIRQRDADEIRHRLASLEGQLSRLSELSGRTELDIQKAWATWWEKATKMGVVLPDIPSPGSAEAPSAIDVAIKQLREIRRSNERRYELCEELISEIETRPLTKEIPDEMPLRQACKSAEEKLSELRNGLERAEKNVAEARQAQVQRRETREELRVLAQLALRHLGRRCPVCDQEYNKATTMQRLESLVKTAAEEAPLVIDNKVMEIAKELEKQEKTQAITKARLVETQDLVREYQNWITRRNSRLKELNISADPESEITEKLHALDTELQNVTSRIGSLQDEGERIALKLAQAAELARRSELEQEINTTHKALKESEEEIRERQLTGDLAGEILEGLRDAAYFVVEDQLKRIEPLLKRIYAMMDPHPLFRDVRLVAKFIRGRGRLKTLINDTQAELSSEFPWAVLSSSQINALAVAVFLSFNLGITNLPIETAMLDDPLQSLDDVNLLGLIDLLRRTKDQRQLIISTHDCRFGRLLERKLRPVNKDRRTIVFEFNGWNRDGPTVTPQEIIPDLKPLRIAVQDPA